MPEGASSRLLERAIELNFDAGETYYRGAEHESSARVAVVVSGLLRLYVSAPNGRTVTVRYIGVGQTVGLHGLVLGAGIATEYPSHPSESVSGNAVHRSRVLHLAKSDVAAVTRSNALLSLAIAKEVAAQAMRDQEMLTANLFRSIRSRVALHLLYLSERDSNGDLFLTVSHREIADAIGSVREVVTRALDRLERDGFIGRREGRILLLNPSKLREISLS